MGDSPIDILDIGAGDGWLSDQLFKHLPAGSRIVCWDADYSADDLVTSASEGITFTAHGPERRFEILLVLDVLEHVEDDREFLEAEVMSRLAPDGRIVVSVPMHPILFSKHDRHLGHFRRYRTRQIRNRLADVVDIEIEGRLFSTLLPARAFGKVLDHVNRSRTAQGIGQWDGGPLVTRIATSVLASDARFGRFAARHGFTAPGLSYWAVGRARVR